MAHRTPTQITGIILYLLGVHVHTILAGNCINAASLCASTKQKYKHELQIPLEDFLTFKINLVKQLN